MNRGTKSLLFGVHQFIIHPFMVVWAWRILYKRWPCLHEWCAIITHDWGYWGSPNMDGPEGERHPEIMANWWIRNYGTLRSKYRNKRQFGNRVGYEIIGHSRFYAGANGLKLSKLFRADKLCFTLYPCWLYILLGTMSGEIHEYMARTIDHVAIDGTSPKMTKTLWYMITSAHMIFMAVYDNNYLWLKEKSPKNAS